ncbi:hypothetical protein [Pendulispora albinea]|uniref:Uncharacterized protein n=1 Tax=Pendulispora albinea TaxID=2741071 RepID=A0ABZ2M1W9_9BACT
MTALTEALRALDGRTKTMRALVESTKPRYRENSLRIVSAVEHQRKSLLIRLEMLQAASADERSADEALREMEATYGKADKKLALLEGWYRPQ